MTASTKGKTAVEDPSVSSQYDTSTPIGEHVQISDIYALVDKQRSLTGSISQIRQLEIYYQ